MPNGKPFTCISQTCDSDIHLQAFYVCTRWNRVVPKTNYAKPESDGTQAERNEAQLSNANTERKPENDRRYE